MDDNEYQRVVVYDIERNHDVAFHGTELASTDKGDVTVWQTRRGNIALYSVEDETLFVRDTFEAFAVHEHDKELVRRVAESLGVAYTEELDI